MSVCKVFNVSGRSSYDKKRVSSRRTIRSRAAATDTNEVTYLEFAERVNGRCAMQGFIWGTVREAFTHKGVTEQLFAHGTLDTESVLYLSGVIGLVALGTAITDVFPNETMNTKSAQFTQDAEIINGRSAMVGFVILAIVTASKS